MLGPKLSLTVDLAKHSADIVILLLALSEIRYTLDVVYDLLACSQVGLALAFIIPALLNLLLKQAVTEGITLGSESASGYAGWQVADQPQSKDDPVIHYDL